jgi:hypothetical protein
MDLDIILRQVPALVLANQQMGAQIAELLVFKADAERRLAALEPHSEEAHSEAVEPARNEQEPASEVPPNHEAAGEAQDGHEDPAAPTPAGEAAEASPEAPQAAEQP